MEFQYWYLAVVAAFLGLIVWGLVAARRKSMFGLAAALIAISGFLLWTLVLEETNIEYDMNSIIDTVAMVGIPAVLGIGLGVFALKSRRV
ncbi:MULTISPECIES: hypothetical protein [Actinoplanes]|uniref:hypothetical protein n=1 Tax=Actinoplanes TaxID=1865 RepID=UPI0005F2F5C4|nr:MULTISPECIES: hypothetical protein [Actinoplanes]GLY08483.1 hypothetical protein Acsp01_88620 [Actinoplanes sp. NBRC 101535]